MRSLWMLTMLSGVVLCLGTSGLGQAPSGAPIPSDSTTTDVAPPTESGQHVDQNKKNIAFRASKLIGMEVKNKEGKDIGSIEDLVFDPHTGKISYAALSRGGVLGIGEKLTAVPWDAFHFQMKHREQRAFREGDEPESRTGVVSDDNFDLILDVDAKTLEQHPGFDKDHWPVKGNHGLFKKGFHPGTQDATSPPGQTSGQSGPPSGQVPDRD